MPKVSQFPLKTDNVVLTWCSESQISQDVHFWQFLRNRVKFLRLQKPLLVKMLIELPLPEGFHEFKMHGIYILPLYFVDIAI